MCNTNQSFFAQPSRETVLICTNLVKLETVVSTQSIQMVAILLMFTATRKQPVEGGQ